MKTNRPLFAFLGVAALVAVAIIVAPVSGSAKITSLLGYGVVLTLLALGVMEYGRGTGPTR